MSASTLTSKGRITIPKDVRERRRRHRLLEELLDQMDAERGPVDESLIEKYVGLLRGTIAS